MVNMITIDMSSDFWKVVLFAIVINALVIVCVAIYNIVHGFKKRKKNSFYSDNIIDVEFNEYNQYKEKPKDSVGRGYTADFQYYDELEFTPSEDKYENDTPFIDVLREILITTDTTRCIQYGDYVNKCANIFYDKIITSDIGIKKEEIRTIALELFEKYDKTIYKQYLTLITNNYEDAIRLEQETSEFNKEIGAGDGFPDHVEDLKIAHPDSEYIPPWDTRLPDDEGIEVIDEEEIKLE